jgi:hypothetical protein
VGDHIESINGENIIGKRHFEVAKKLKELKKEELFTMTLIEPKKAFGKLCVCVCVRERELSFPWFIFLRERNSGLWHHVFLSISSYPTYSVTNIENDSFTYKENIKEGKKGKIALTMDIF